MKQDYSKIIEELGSEKVKIDEPLAPHTTFKIGGPADLFCKAESVDELVKAVKLARKLGIPYFILGGGSNVLVADEGFRGLVIKVKSSNLKVQSASRRTKFKILAEAGVSLRRLVEFSVQKSLTGLEFAVGIPGTVGGAVRGNAGAWLQSIGEKVHRVKVLDEKGEMEWIQKKNCQFAYRQSRFKESQEIILEIELELEEGSRGEIEEQIRINQERRAVQPKQPSAGCIFVNPRPKAAGELIEDSGLKGKRIGDAQISPLHANFIVNLGKARANDVVRLIKLAKKEVKKKFGMELKEEICLIGFGRI